MALTSPIKIATALAITVCLISACASKPTQYYRLEVDNTGQLHEVPEDISLGVDIVKIADNLDREGIVSRVGPNEMQVSLFNIWGGDLDKQFARVLTGSLAEQLGLDSVFSIPWDTRHRPEYQIRVIIDQFSGDIDGNVEIRARYTLYADKGRESLGSKVYKDSAQSGGSYRSYVVTLNELLNGLTQQAAGDIAQIINDTK